MPAGAPFVGAEASATAGEASSVSAAARARQPESNDRRQGARPAVGLYARKLHSFWPTNESGVAAAIEIACAITFGKPAPSTSEISST